MKGYTRIALTKDRLREAMEAANKKQADLVKETGLNRGTISRYLSVDTYPEKLSLVRMQLTSSPKFLMYRKHGCGDMTFL